MEIKKISDDSADIIRDIRGQISAVIGNTDSYINFLFESNNIDKNKYAFSEGKMVFVPINEVERTCRSKRGFYFAVKGK